MLEGKSVIVWHQLRRLRHIRRDPARLILRQQLWPLIAVTAGTRRRRCGNTIQTDKADEAVRGDLPCCGIRRFF